MGGVCSFLFNRLWYFGHGIPYIKSTYNIVLLGEYDNIKTRDDRPPSNELFENLKSSWEFLNTLLKLRGLYRSTCF